MEQCYFQPDNHSLSVKLLPGYQAQQDTVDIVPQLPESSAHSSAYLAYIV